MNYQLRHVFPEPISFPNDIELISLGVRENMPQGILDRSQASDHFLFMFFYDEVYLGINGKNALHAKHSLVLYQPGQSHYYGHDEHAWSHSWIMCRGKGIEQYLKRYRLFKNEISHSKGPLPIDRYLDELFHQCNDYQQPNQAIVSNIIENMICDFARYTANTDLARIPDRMLKIKHHIDQHWQTPLRLEVLARMAHYTVPHLCQTFKKYFGYAPIDYAIQLRMQQAIHLLRNPNLSITQIATDLGYDDLFYFSKYFKKFHGESPSAIRKKL